MVTHYVNADWELQKRVIGFRLIEVKHSGENIADRIASVVEFGDLCCHSRQCFF